MAGNSFGQAFRVTTAGESHGPANVVIIDGCPPGLAITPEEIQRDLDRRRPGQSRIVTQRQEADQAEILSGVFEGVTTGTSISILIRNQDQRSRDYTAIKDKYRPGHADYSFDAKYGRRDYRGGGRSSARETVARVAAGAIAKALLADAVNCRVVAYVKQIGDIIASVPEPEAISLRDVETLADGKPNIVRCPDAEAGEKMIALIDSLRKAGDSIGGIAEIVVIDPPAGLGEPVFDKLKADLGKALFSLPAVLGVEYGIGFGCATMRGTQNNDTFMVTSKNDSMVTSKKDSMATSKKDSVSPTEARGTIRTRSNRHGGILGGISSGMPIVLRAAVKPTSSLPTEQNTVTSSGEATTIRTTGRHDPCLLPRFIPMAEAMVALVLADHYLRWRGQTGG